MLETSRFCHMVQKTLKYLRKGCNLKLPCAVRENTASNEWGEDMENRNPLGSSLYFSTSFGTIDIFVLSLRYSLVTCHRPALSGKSTIITSSSPVTNTGQEKHLLAISTCEPRSIHLHDKRPIGKPYRSYMSGHYHQIRLINIE